MNVKRSTANRVLLAGVVGGLVVVAGLLAFQFLEENGVKLSMLVYHLLFGAAVFSIASADRFFIKKTLRRVQNGQRTS